MVWLSKREVAYLILLRKVFNDNPFNIGEALDVLKIFGSKRIARKVIKKLTAKGFLERIDLMSYRIRDLEEAFLGLLIEYLAQRMFRNLKSRGIDAHIRVDKSLLKVFVEVCESEVIEVLEKLRDIIEVRCREEH